MSERARKRRVVFAVGLGLLAIQLALGLAFAHAATVELLGIIAVSLLAVGKFLPLWGISEHCRFSPWELGVVVWLMDTCTVLIVLYAHERLCRIATIGRLFARAQEKANAVLAAYPRAKKGAVVAVVAFVLFPLAGTGATVGAFLGLLLGLHRHVVIAAVTAGGFLGGMLMALLAVYASDALIQLRDLQSGTGKYAVLGVLLLAVLLGARWLSRAYKRAMAARPASDAVTEPE